MGSTYKSRGYPSPVAFTAGFIAKVLLATVLSNGNLNPLHSVPQKSLSSHSSTCLSIHSCSRQKSFNLENSLGLNFGSVRAEIDKVIILGLSLSLCSDNDTSSAVEV